ncbi:hypothetical protein KI387_004607, partial [Taxus chinensis]
MGIVELDNHKNESEDPRGERCVLFIDVVTRFIGDECIVDEHFVLNSSPEETNNAWFNCPACDENAEMITSSHERNFQEQSMCMCKRDGDRCPCGSVAGVIQNESEKLFQQFLIASVKLLNICQSGHWIQICWEALSSRRRDVFETVLELKVAIVEDTVLKKRKKLNTELSTKAENRVNRQLGSDASSSSILWCEETLENASSDFYLIQLLALKLVITHGAFSSDQNIPGPLVIKLVNGSRSMYSSDNLFDIGGR